MMMKTSQRRLPRPSLGNADSDLLDDDDNDDVSGRLTLHSSVRQSSLMFLLLSLHLESSCRSRDHRLETKADIIPASDQSDSPVSGNTWSMFANGLTYCVCVCARHRVTTVGSSCWQCCHGNEHSLAVTLNFKTYWSLFWKSTEEDQGHGEYFSPILI